MAVLARLVSTATTDNTNFYSQQNTRGRHRERAADLGVSTGVILTRLDLRGGGRRLPGLVL